MIKKISKVDTLVFCTQYTRDVTVYNLVLHSYLDRPHKKYEYVPSI